MKIENYTSGRHMRIDGSTYRSDLKIINGRIIDNWWRDRGHRLDPADINDILTARPSVLVIGTGYAGAMQVPDETFSTLSSQGIEVIAERTLKAVRTFNRLSGEDNAVAGAFHLTC